MKLNLIAPIAIISFLALINHSCNSSSNKPPTIEQKLDSSFQSFLSGVDSIPIERKLIAMGSRDTVWLHDLIQVKMDSLNQLLTDKDSLLKQANDFDKSAKVLQGIMPVDAQGMQIQATKMRLDVLNWENSRDSLQSELVNSEKTPIPKYIVCEARYLEWKGEEQDSSDYEIQYLPGEKMTVWLASKKQ